MFWFCFHASPTSSGTKTGSEAAQTPPGGEQRYDNSAPNHPLFWEKSNLITFLPQFSLLEAPLLQPHINGMISELFNLKHQNTSRQTFRLPLEQPPSRSAGAGFMQEFGDRRETTAANLPV